MQYTQAEHGRVFILRLEEGEVLHEEIEKFAREKEVKSAALIAVGGVGEGSKLVVGPEDGDKRPVVPMFHNLDDVHELAGTGTLFTDEEGNPILHMHSSCGRNEETITGCVRSGIKVWQIMEIVMFELIGSSAKRVLDDELGVKLLNLKDNK
ncbi:PPC domain-containing DNA-binding protein [Natranaerofaba carboxydovora]|uniref:PPC domain-containing DNA-binding protein n=1 Tax=Natranaerofaba carboxydovora TaxID=2742683 RepID=UPI001F13FD34|nr:PPC domain-containing DNA-binding protein [Natranaerofaba carboxydovora]UMZ73786.1 hypothetical protein ACONDI_01355 [Natranaerofaba carboxydovora]